MTCSEVLKCWRRFSSVSISTFPAKGHYKWRVAGPVWWMHLLSSYVAIRPSSNENPPSRCCWTALLLLVGRTVIHSFSSISNDPRTVTTSANSSIPPDPWPLLCVSLSTERYMFPLDLNNLPSLYSMSSSSLNWTSLVCTPLEYSKTSSLVTVRWILLSPPWPAE